MIREHAQQAQYRRTRHNYEALFDKLLFFSEGPPFGVDVMSAFHLFWNGHYSVRAAKALDKRDLLRFFDWYVFDYLTWEAKKPVIQIFRDNEGYQLPPGEREMLASWQDSVMSLYRLEEANPGNYLLLHDSFQEASYQVSDSQFSHVAAQGDLLLSRVLKSEELWHLSILPTLLPPAMESGILEFVNHAWQGYQEAHYQATKKAFLRESSQLFNHYLVQQAQTAGEQPSRAAKYYDISKAIAALQRGQEEARQERAEKLREELEEERAEEEEKRAKEAEAEPKPIAGGRLLLPGDRPISVPRPEESHKTIAGGKLLLP